MDKILKKLNKYLKKNEGTDAAVILGDLLTALDKGTEFRLVRLYGLPYDAFELSLLLLKEWRLASYIFKSGDLPNALKMAGDDISDVSRSKESEARFVEQYATE